MQVRNISPSEYFQIQNAQTTSASVERSFSMLKNHPSKKKNFSPEYVVNYAIVNFNSSVQTINFVLSRLRFTFTISLLQKHSLSCCNLLLYSLCHYSSLLHCQQRYFVFCVISQNTVKILKLIGQNLYPFRSKFVRPNYEYIICFIIDNYSHNKQNAPVQHLLYSFYSYPSNNHDYF